MTKIIDLSHPIHTATPPWPGSPSVEITSLDRARLSTPETRHSNSSRFAMNIHCGTHMDAPFHFIDDGRTIDSMPLERMYGRATLVRLPGKGPGSQISSEDLRPWEKALRRTGKAILQTGWSSRWTQHDFFCRLPYHLGGCRQISGRVPGPSGRRGNRIGRFSAARHPHRVARQ